MQNTHDPDQAGKSADSAAEKPREYEKSGMYPEDGKPFRMFALLGWLAGVVVLMAAAAAILDFMVV